MSTIEKAARYVGARVAYATLQPINRPLHVELIVTLKCSLQCPHCDSWRTSHSQELTVDQWKHVVARTNQWLGPVPIYVAGGEPFLKPGIGDLMRFITRQGNPLYTMTNGQHDLVDADFDSILVSIYSLDPAINDSIRGCPGGHQKAMAFLEDLLAKRDGRQARNKMRVNISFLVTSENYQEMPQFVEHFSKKGVSTSFMALRKNPLDVFTAGSAEYDMNWYKANPLWIHDMAGLEKAVHEVIALKKSGFLVNNYASALLRYVDYYRSPESILGSPCYMPALSYTIGPTGDVRICYYSANVGNVLREHPREIWKSAKRLGELGELRACARYCRINSNYNFLDWREGVRSAWAAGARHLPLRQVGRGLLELAGRGK